MSRKVRHDLRSTGVPLPYAGACGKRSSRRGSADFSAFRRLKPRERLEDTNVEAKLKVLIRHLVTSFPETSILSREIAGRYHLFIIVPYSGGPEKAIQVDRAVLREPALSEDEFASRIRPSGSAGHPARMRPVRSRDLAVGSLRRDQPAIMFPETPTPCPPAQQLLGRTRTDPLWTVRASGFCECRTLNPRMIYGCPISH